MAPKTQMPRRGRPKGRDGVDDRETLEKVARLLMAEPKLCITAAIRGVMPPSGQSVDSTVHRLRRKWKERGPAILEAAKRAKAASSNHKPDARGAFFPPLSSISAYLHAQNEMMQTQKQMQEMLGRINACGTAQERALATSTSAYREYLTATAATMESVRVQQQLLEHSRQIESFKHAFSVGRGYW